MPHTSDFNIIVQVLDDTSIQITEQIQFITTKPDTIFERKLNTVWRHSNGRTMKADIRPLAVYRNGRPVRSEHRADETSLTLSLPDKLPTGLHRFTVQYLVTGGILKTPALTEVFLPLTGMHWPLMTERFSVVVLLPKKTPFFVKELLFGSNNQSVPDTVIDQTDPTGALVYQLTRALPAFTDVRLHLTLDKDALPAGDTNRSVWENMSVVGIYGLILIFYVFLSVISARRRVWDKPLVQSRRLNPLLWLSQISRDLTPRDIEKLDHRLQVAGQTIRGIHLGPRMLKLISFIRFNGEYITGIIIMLGCLLFLSCRHGIRPEAWMTGLVLIESGIALYAIDRFGTKAALENLKHVLQQTLTQTPQGLSLPRRDIPLYLKFAICLGFATMWRDKLIENNPAYKDLFSEGRKR